MFYIFRVHDGRRMASFDTQRAAEKALFAYWRGSQGTAAYEVRDVLGGLRAGIDQSGRTFQTPRG
jgi:hypothetical protein